MDVRLKYKWIFKGKIKKLLFSVPITFETPFYTGSVNALCVGPELYNLSSDKAACSWYGVSRKLAIRVVVPY